MKILYALLGVIFVLPSFAQKNPIQKRIYNKPLPPLTYSINSDTNVIYSSVDNMPILYGQTQMSMPNAVPKKGLDSASIYKLPNPLYRRRIPSEKP